MRLQPLLWSFWFILLLCHMVGRSVGNSASRWSHHSRKNNKTLWLLLIPANEEMEGTMDSIIEHAMLNSKNKTSISWFGMKVSARLIEGQTNSCLFEGLFETKKQIVT